MESIPILNGRLKDLYGKTSGGDQALWRIVWSEDQFEIRFGDYEDRTTEGLLIRQVSEYRKVPKYRQWIHAKYVLERLIVVPETNTTELTTKLSYEPIYVFEDGEGNPLLPIWNAIEFVIKQVYKNMEQHNTVPKYQDPESDTVNAKEIREQDILNLERDLYGNETKIGDSLEKKEGVGFTTSKTFSGQERRELNVDSTDARRNR